MKKFVVFIAKLLVIVVLSAVVLDVLYTMIYVNSSKRNKIEYVYNSKGKNFDVVFMGSSRTQNHMMAKLFDEKGIKAYNFGMSGSKLDETALLLKLMLERNYKIKNIFLDVDLNLNSNSKSEGTKALYMPYLHCSETIRNHYKTEASYNKLLYIPFYRYIEGDAKIGFREMFFSLTNKKSNALDNFGYFPLQGEGRNMKYDLSDYKPKRNFAYEEIKAICKKNNIHLIAIATPMCPECQSDAYFNSIKSVYPEVYNYENKVTDDKDFASCGHMNVDGARLFTSIILNDFIQNKFH
ncbi:hypothetical protein [Flavobacterium wongokense]|uniref:hypothetical protein n=1 Tax=Flavobacterium wongokense TaxID=2910674 RepID=UPI001F1CFF09|nr:hypothetical protein [Flavobacterium sp. WG47]MCF6133016.1 hypothetical protein [Flavobacterium sp. WG47]